MNNNYNERHFWGISEAIFSLDTASKLEILDHYFECNEIIKI